MTIMNTRHRGTAPQEQAELLPRTKFHIHNEGYAEAACWSRGAPAAVFEANATRASRLHAIILPVRCVTPGLEPTRSSIKAGLGATLLFVTLFALVSQAAPVAPPVIMIGSEGVALGKWLLIGPFSAGSAPDPVDVDFLEACGCKES